MKASKEIEDIITEGRKIFGIENGWNIYVDMTDKPCGSKAYSGSCQTNSPYLNAEIELAIDIKEEEIRDIIYHELLHISFCNLQDVSDEMICGMSKKRKKNFKKKYHDTTEQIIQRLSRSISSYIDSKEKKK